MGWIKTTLVALWVAVCTTIAFEISTLSSYAVLFDVPLSELVSMTHIHKIFHHSMIELRSLRHISSTVLVEILLSLFILYTVLSCIHRCGKYATDLVGHVVAPPPSPSPYSQETDTVVNTVTNTVANTVIDSLSSLPARLASLELVVQSLYDFVTTNLTRNDHTTQRRTGRIFTMNRTIRLLRHHVRIAKRNLHVRHIQAVRDSLAVTKLTTQVSSLTKILPLLIAVWSKVPAETRANITRCMQFEHVHTQLLEQQLPSTRQYMQLDNYLSTLATGTSDDIQNCQDLQEVTEERNDLNRQLENLRTELATAKQVALETNGTIQSLRAEVKQSRNSELQQTNELAKQQSIASKLQDINQKLLQQKHKEILVLQDENSQLLKAKEDELADLRAQIAALAATKDAEISGLRSEISSISTSYDTRSPSNSIQAGEVSALQQQISSLSVQHEVEIAQLRKDIDSKAKDLKFTNTNLDTVDRENCEMKEEWASLHSIIEDSNGNWSRLGRKFGLPPQTWNQKLSDLMQADSKMIMNERLGGLGPALIMRRARYEMEASEICSFEPVLKFVQEIFRVHPELEECAKTPVQSLLSRCLQVPSSQLTNPANSTAAKPNAMGTAYQAVPGSAASASSQGAHQKVAPATPVSTAGSAPPQPAAETPGASLMSSRYSNNSNSGGTQATKTGLMGSIPGSQTASFARSTAPSNQPTLETLGAPPTPTTQQANDFRQAKHPNSRQGRGGYFNSSTSKPKPSSGGAAPAAPSAPGQVGQGMRASKWST